MSLQKRLVALVALLLVIGLVVADVAVYTSVRSFLYGQADATLAQDEALGFNYLTFAAAAPDDGRLGRPLPARLGGGLPDAPRPPRARRWCAAPRARPHAPTPHPS